MMKEVRAESYQALKKLAVSRELWEWQSSHQQVLYDHKSKENKIQGI